MDQGFWVVIPVMRAPASPTIDRDNPFKSPPTEVTKTTPIPSAIAAKTTQSIWVALVWALLYVVYTDFGVTEKFFLAMCKAGVLSNVVMFAFNLFPLPPLDGGRIVVGLLPLKQAYLFSRIEPYGFFIVVALAITGVVNHLWLDPVMGATFGLIELMLKSIS